MSTFNEYTFLSADKKTEIYVREYVPEGNIKGYVQIAHGVAEYAARYDEFMQFLANNGYAVAANDHLGHGKSVVSEEARGYFAKENGWDIVVSDMKTLHDMLKKRFPKQRSVLFGHSMGSFLSRTYIIKYPFDFDEAIICGTGQQSKLIVKAGEIIAKRECKKKGAMKPSEKLEKLAFGGYNKAFKPERTPQDWLSKNEANVDKYRDDPLCGRISSAGLYRDMLHGIGFVGSKKNIEKMNKSMPIFLIAGSMDPVGENGKAVKRVYEMYKEAGIKGQVYEDILAWLEKQA